MTTPKLGTQRLIVPSDQAAQFSTFIHRYMQEIQAKGSVENTLLDQMIDSAWNLRRFTFLEADLYQLAGIDPLLSNDRDIQQKYARIMRHKIFHTRVWHRAFKDLKTLQNHRLQREAALQAAGPTAAAPAAEGPLTPAQQAELEQLYADIEREKQDLESFVNSNGNLFTG